MVQPGVSAFGKKKRTTYLPRNSLSETSRSFSSGKVKSGALSWMFMGASLSRPTYRIAARAVICVFAGLGLVAAQIAQRTSVSKGPRAVALLRLQANGKAQLIPVSIMVDGRFYDASAYKATPVPMALENGTVYEAERTGNSLGLFTVTKVVQQKNSWIGDGNWLPAGTTPPSTGMKAETKPREDEDKPPTLRRGGSSSASDKASDSAKPQIAPPSSGTSSSSPSNEADDRPRLKSGAPAKDQPPQSQGAERPTPASTTPRENPATANAGQEAEDPSRPTLKRGKQPPVRSTTATTIPGAKAGKAASGSSSKSTQKNEAAPSSPASTAAPGAQLIPAISDANGPEPRPYSYDMKPGEEQTFRKKMLALAAEEFWKNAKLYDPALASVQTAPKVTNARGAKNGSSKAPQPNFEDVTFKVFDVATNNEPILVLTATATLPHSAVKSAASDQPQPSYYITLVTHSDMYGELRTLLSAVTNDRHLDVSPRMNFIDAVDADGDGRAELLFEQLFDTGKAYVIYRVGADQLWALYQGTPGASS
jgi:hypothetical protein